jgi:hypothetical protein
VTVIDTAAGFNATPTFNWRLFWFNGEGISYLDFSETYERSDLGTGPASGTLAAPFLWGRSGPSQFISTQDNFEDHASLSASISRFGDMQCKKPL